MSKTFCKKLFITAAVVTMWTTIDPDALHAQTSGVGCDGSTRFLWRGTDSSISLWRVDASLNNPINHVYGPYDGYVPIAMTVLCNSHTYVLWKYTDGSISLWDVDPNLVFLTSHVYGPYTGWIPESLSPDQASPGSFRVLWRETKGQISIWVVDSSLNVGPNKVYGPFFGYDPHADALSSLVARPADGSSTHSDQAAEAMKVNTVTIPMPK